MSQMSYVQAPDFVDDVLEGALGRVRLWPPAIRSVIDSTALQILGVDSYVIDRVLGRHSIDKGRPVVYGLPHRRRCFGKKS